jgi:hypothetical protein
MSLFAFEITSLVMGLVPVAIQGVIAWYMMQPHVKAAFGS